MTHLKPIKNARTNNPDNYVVHHTDYVGGEFIREGIIGGYEIGGIVVIPDGIIGQIISAHKYPNGRIDYNIEYTEPYCMPERHSYSKNLLDSLNPI